MNSYIPEHTEKKLVTAAFYVYLLPACALFMYVRPSALCMCMCIAALYVCAFCMPACARDDCYHTLHGLPRVFLGRVA